MGLLDKFAVVEIRNDVRISAADKGFCETQQESYDAARRTFAELKTFWNAAAQTQDEIFFDSLTGSKRCIGYLSAIENISIKKINEAIESIQAEFIQKLVRHFCTTYTISVDEDLITEHLLPQEPDGGRKNFSAEDIKEYRRQLRTVSLRYEQVLDEIFLQLDGRSLTDSAFNELRETCHAAAWNKDRKRANYEVQKNVVRFTNYACRYSAGFNTTGTWSLCDSAKAILRGIAHFETNSFRCLPSGFSELLCHTGVLQQTIEFPACEKMVQLKMFKNNRVDIKFASAQLAAQFTEDYLGLVF